jgi:hypothetical protein
MLVRRRPACLLAASAPGVSWRVPLCLRCCSSSCVTQPMPPRASCRSVLTALSSHSIGAPACGVYSRHASIRRCGTTTLSSLQPAPASAAGVLVPVCRAVTTPANPCRPCAMHHGALRSSFSGRGAPWGTGLAPASQEACSSEGACSSSADLTPPDVCHCGSSGASSP